MLLRRAYPQQGSIGFLLLWFIYLSIINKVSTNFRSFSKSRGPTVFCHLQKPWACEGQALVFWFLPYGTAAHNTIGSRLWKNLSKPPKFSYELFSEAYNVCVWLCVFRKKGCGYLLWWITMVWFYLLLIIWLFSTNTVLLLPGLCESERRSVLP